MSIRTFKAANLQAALADIREQMGPDASVLHTRQVRDGWLGWLGRTQVEVIAGSRGVGGYPPSMTSDDDHSPFADDVPSPDRYSDGLFSGTVPSSDRAGYGETISMKFADFGDTNDVDPLSIDPLVGPLRQAGVPEVVIRRWLASASSFAGNLGVNDRLPYDVNGRLEHLQRAISRELNLCGPIRTQPGERHVVALVGPTGVGKTTTVAKLAAGFRIESKRRVGLLTIDTYRIAAVQQLQAYAEIMDLPMQVVEQPEQMQPAMDQLGDVDLVLIDTAGRSPRSDARIDQLAEFLRAAQPDETHLVLSATSSSENIVATLSGFTPVRATSVILTKLDETPHTAGVLSALTASERYLSTPLSYITHGQQVPDDIAVADAPNLVGALLPMTPLTVPFGEAA
ncbi:flagellar biosynthesis protein FlhF [Allorhodopirellula heiligendammensis]|uniref:Flagellar biosynthesis protein FlhF n=1 Tax=Allorhodopirellula heiligendammensis TaxID=2714739 RepID=A0A5C6BYV9_9BACT|nr:flagellar biosynthesis protein FlhF [Allorhodopirellula heiligendammensis]TWU17032.1 Flagellar biosynthesis protein FlhF [Allorhodopirellula heiligendammensis]